MMKKFPRIRYPGDEQTDGIMNGEVVVTEKFDGANFRFTIDDDLNIVSGSRNVVFTEGDSPLPLDEVSASFRHAIEYLRERLDEDNRKFILGDAENNKLTLYGEAMHLHSLQYEDIKYESPESGSPYPTNVPNVVLFDARSDGGKWVPWDSFESIANGLGLEHAPVLERGDPEDLDLEIPDESIFGGQPEGIVARRIDGSVRAKKVADDFKEKNAVSFNDSSKAQTDAGRFVAAYVTDARIEKQAHKLVDEGDYNSIQMEMMRDLPREVLVDAVSENAWELLTDPEVEVMWDDDFIGKVRSKTSSKCARVLKTMLNEF